MFLKKPCDLYIRSVYGCTALDVAKNEEKHSIVELLEKALQTQGPGAMSVHEDGSATALRKLLN